MKTTPRIKDCNIHKLGAKTTMYIRKEEGGEVSYLPVLVDKDTVVKGQELIVICKPGESLIEAIHRGLSSEVEEPDCETCEGWEPPPFRIDIETDSTLPNQEQDRWKAVDEVIERRLTLLSDAIGVSFKTILYAYDRMRKSEVK